MSILVLRMDALKYALLLYSHTLSAVPSLVCFNRLPSDWLGVVSGLVCLFCFFNDRGEKWDLVSYYLKTPWSWFNNFSGRRFLAKQWAQQGSWDRSWRETDKTALCNPHSPIYLGSDLRILPQDDSGTCRQDVLGPGIHSSSSFWAKQNVLENSMWFLW